LLRSTLESESRRLVKTAGLLSGVFIIGGITLALCSGRSISLGLASIFLLLFGFALLTPLFTLSLMALLERLSKAYPSILVRLPARMVSAEISRTGTAIAALTIAVSAAVGMDLMIGSFRQTVSDWINTSLQADLYVSLPGEKLPGESTQHYQQLKTTLAQFPGVQMLSSVLHTKCVF
jgi:putative ABC transport system permease protein